MISETKRKRKRTIHPVFLQMNEEKKDSATSSPSGDPRFDWSNREHSLAFITVLCKKVEKRRNEKKSRLFRSILEESRNAVLKKAKSNLNNGSSSLAALSSGKMNSTSEKSSALPLLPSHSERFVESNDAIGFYKYKVRLLQSRRWKNHQIIEPITIENVITERPTSKSTVFLKSNYTAEDERDLNFAPYFGDDDEDETEILQELFDTQKRDELLDSGPEHVQEDRNSFIDEVLEAVLKDWEQRLASLPNTRLRTDLLNIETIMCRVHDHIALTKGFDHEDIRQRCALIFESRMEKVFLGKVSPAEVSKVSSKDSSSLEVTKNSEFITDDRVYYGDMMDSFRHLFCRRCFVYDCNRHGIVAQSNLELQTTLAMRNEKEKSWQGTQQMRKGPSENITADVSLKESSGDGNCENENIDTKESSRPPKPLSTIQRAVCEHAYQIFDGDLNKIGTVLNAQAEDIESHARKESIQLVSYEQKYCQLVGTADRKSRKKKRKHDDTSMNKFDQAWLKRVETAEIFPAFEPCDHPEPCSEETCSCAQNAHFCTKHCIWGKDSRYYFMGCRCKRGDCRGKSCPCFAAGKECDPDLCSECGACTDDPTKPATKQRCRNDNIGMRRHIQLAVAASHVKEAGWGLYNKTALKKGDFVHEYLGEVISQEEADRRGCIYDKVNRSYLFNLTSDTVVDASRKGNKTKFLNHSSNPNCYTKILSVSGDARIGIFAKEDVDPQTELFFDYRYDVSMSNDLIEMPAMEVSWMKKKKTLKKKAHKKHAKQGQKDRSSRSPTPG